MSSDPTSLYSRKNPFPATHPVNRKLSGEGSGKDTRHHEISLAGSGLHYEVGDSMGLFATNDPVLVDEIIAAIGATGEESVPGADGQPKSLRDALISDYIITTPSKEFLKAIVEKAAPALADLRDLSNDPAQKKALEDYLWGIEFIDFLLDHHTVKWTAEEFVKTLRKLQPRLYSIASSLKANPESVHLTVATVRYESHGRLRKGVASTFLAERWAGEKTAGVFIHTAKHFRLPENGDTPIIMVGPGTGVAPFRAYIQERQVTGTKGKNWLFFGEQTRARDFLYEQELAALQADGVLHKLDVAFSATRRRRFTCRIKCARTLRNSGRGSRKARTSTSAAMAPAWPRTWTPNCTASPETHGGKSPEEAAAYIESLKKEKRYKKDVY